MKAPADSTLQSWWRKAVKAVHGDACVICGQRPVECHHAVLRRKMVLRHDFRNGLPLCADCHRGAETILGRAEVAKHLDMEYLQERERLTLKDYLVRNGMTRAEFLQNQLDELKAICDNPSVAKHW